MPRVLALVLLLATVKTTAAGDAGSLRMAAIAPDGTAWARELKALARDVEAQSNGELRIKWYLGAIAGDELTALERVKRAQLDGEAGASFCQRLAPPLRAARLVGMYQSHQEAALSFHWSTQARYFADLEAPPDDGVGQVRTVTVSDRALLQRLAGRAITLRLRVPEGKNAHGLCVYGAPTGKKTAPSDTQPIRVVFERAKGGQ